MSTRRDNERLRMDNERLVEKLQEAQVLAEAQLRNVERLATKAARTDEAEAALARTHADRAEAWRQVAQRDAVIRELTEQRDTAIAAVEAMAVEGQAAGWAS